MEASAERVVEATPDAVFGLLADLAQHWRLAGDWVEVLALEPPTGPARGAVVRLRGPLGVRRVARTRVDVIESPVRLAGQAHAGRATRAAVEWRLEPAEEGTRVRLGLVPVRASPADRALWALGGRRWAQRRLQATLEHLGQWAAIRRGQASAPSPAGTRGSPSAR